MNRIILVTDDLSLSETLFFKIKSKYIWSYIILLSNKLTTLIVIFKDKSSTLSCIAYYYYLFFYFRLLRKFPLKFLDNQQQHLENGHGWSGTKGADHSGLSPSNCQGWLFYWYFSIILTQKWTHYFMSASTIVSPL